MRNLLILFTVFLLITCSVYSQDSIRLYFKGENIALSAIKEGLILNVKDSFFSETIFNVGGNKFLYLKRSINDTLPVELGQLGIYKIDNRLYLLREGIWAVEWSKEKLLMDNSGEGSTFPEEYPTSTEPVMMSDRDQSKRKRKSVRVISHR